MFDNVVVGVGDDQGGRDALALARQLVSTDGKLTLVHVDILAFAPPPDADRNGPWEVARRTRALKRLAALRGEAHVEADLMCVEARSVAAGLHEAVRRDDDLLAIGASRRDDYERTFVGDDTREALKDPRCTVAVAPAGYATYAHPLQTIGVAYDGSPGSEQALAVARDLARGRRAELSVVEAVPEPIRVRDPWNPEVEIQEGVARARQRVAELGDAEPHAASGDSVEELARYSASVDLLVLGPHQQRPIDHLMGGSTSQRLADRARCPLLVLAYADRAARA